MRTKSLVLSVFAVLFVVASASNTFGQFFNGNIGNRVVGGVKIDSDGIVRDLLEADKAGELARLRDAVQGGKGELAKAANVRLISLKSVQEAMAKSAASGEPLPEEIAFLGGLTRVQYVFVAPESQDIIIGGPAEGWTVSKSGAIVGSESGLPIVNLEDFVVAFRAMSPSSERLVSCSIDPTDEGRLNLQKFLSQVQLGPTSNPKQLEPAMKKAFGMQRVTLSGVPTDSHAAHVLLAADYQMKRIGMNLVDAPVKGLPSYIEMIRSVRIKAPQNRWWMACDYNPIEQTDDKLAWKLTGRGIKTFTEHEFVKSDGSVAPSGNKDASAEKWADLFTERMVDLERVEPVFGELRNFMDCCVISALIHRHRLNEVAGMSVDVLGGQTATLQPTKLATPDGLAPQCSFLKTAGGWIATASGGVMIDGWTVTNETKTSPELEALRSKHLVKTSAAIW